MVSSKMIVTNKSGLHAKPLRDFINLVKTFDCKVEVENNDKHKRVKATSLLSVLTLRVVQGTEITIYCHGEDEQKALDSIIKLISNLED